MLSIDLTLDSEVLNSLTDLLPLFLGLYLDDGTRQLDSISNGLRCDRSVSELERLLKCVSSEVLDYGCDASTGDQCGW